MSPSRPLPAASSSSDLPADALYEVLLRIPAKELCRLRAVSPAWRALTSDPIFVAAHKSRHHTAPPLLATAYRDHSGVSGVSISDLSGNVVKRIPSTGYEIVMVNKSGDPIGRMSSKDDSLCVVRTRLDLVCFNWIDYPMAFSALNPATGATIDLPTGRSKELEHELEVEGIEKWRCQVESCAFGQVSSTREYKALRVFRIDDDRQVCEVITFDDTNHGSWRRKQDPPSHISTSRKMRCVVVDGVVHFLMDFCFSYFKTRSITIEPGCVASFNLETEEWSVLRGPEQVQSFVQDNEDYHYINLELELSVAELDDCLVMVHDIRSTSMNLWFLADSEKGIWVKKYNMLSHVARPRIYPLLTLDDGGIYFSGENYLQGFLSSGESERGFLRSYDPRNDTYSDALKLNDSKSIGIYTGSLLSL